MPPFVPLWSLHLLQPGQGKTVCPLLMLCKWRGVQGHQLQTLPHHRAQASVAGDLHSARLRPPVCECRCQFQLRIQGFAKQFSGYLYNAALTQSLQHSGHVKASNCTTLCDRVGSPLCLLPCQPSNHWLPRL